jgi:hypothetical protein
MTVVEKRTEQGLRLTGEEDELGTRLVALIAAGRVGPDGLVDEGQLSDGRYYATVRLLPPRQPAPVRRRELSPEMFAAGFIAATVLVGAALLVFLLGHLQLVAIAVLVLLGWLGLGQVGACPGVHCPGCKHR